VVTINVLLPPVYVMIDLTAGSVNLVNHDVILSIWYYPLFSISVSCCELFTKTQQFRCFYMYIIIYGYYFDLSKQKPGWVYHLQRSSETCKETSPACSVCRYFIEMCCCYVVFRRRRLGVDVPESTLCSTFLNRRCVLSRREHGQNVRLSAV
jgi:hypothetical protein